MEIIEYKNIKIRKDTYDKAIISEVKRSYSWMEPKNEVVLDVGACFGAYSLLAHNQGASKIWAFEPEKNNYNLTKLNTNNYENIQVFNKALVNSEKKFIDFYLTKGRNFANFSMIKYRGRNKITVEAENFTNILNELKPSVIKMDCEGAEYELLEKPLPNFVKKITIEIHLDKKEFRYYKAKNLIDKFKSWNCKLKPQVGEKNWHTLGAWYR